MRIEVAHQLHVPAPNDKLTGIVMDAVDHMKNTEQVNPLNSVGMAELVSDTNLFEKYAMKLAEGMSVNSKDAFLKLAENSYYFMFNESSTSSMAPLSMLTLPMLRRAWPKIGIKEAIPTEVVKKPVFKVASMRPYATLKEPVVAGQTSGTRKIYELPGDPTKHSISDMRKHFKKTTLRTLANVNDNGYAMVSGKAYAPSSSQARTTTGDRGALVVDGTEKTFSAGDGYTHDQANGYTISSDIGVLAVTLEYWDTAEVASQAQDNSRRGVTNGAQIAAGLKTVTLPVGFRGEMYSRVTGEQGKYMTLSVVDDTLSGADGTQVYSNPRARFHPETGGILLNLQFRVDSLGGTNAEDVEATGGIMGVFERGAWKFAAASLNSASPTTGTKTTIKITHVYLDGSIETTQNKDALQVGFDISTRNIEIPTGEHIEANFGLEWLQDTLAMYNIDGVLQLTTIISDLIVNKVDIEGIEFIEDTFDRFSAQLDQGRASDGGAKIVTRTFNVHPPARFNGSVHEWINGELKRIVDNLASTLNSLTYMNEGTFVLVGNPTNINLLNQSTWHFVEGDEGEDGVTLGYSVGEFRSGTKRYKLFASQNIEYDSTDATGDVNALWLFFIPSNPQYKTLCYFPYTFNAIKSSEGWVSPNSPNVPALMMTKRHKFEEFFKVFGKVKIQNNTGSTG